MSGKDPESSPRRAKGDTPTTGFAALKPLLAELSPRRWMQLRLTVMLMLLGGFAEMVGLGAVLAFLALLAKSDTSPGGAAVVALFEWLGWRSGRDLILPAVFLLVGTGLIATAIRLLLAWVSHKFVLRVGHDIGVEIYSRMLRQPYSLHVQRNTSEVVAGIEKVQIVLFAVLLPLMQAVVSTVIALFIIIALLAIDWLVALIAGISIAIPYVLVSVATRKLLRDNSETLSVKQTERIKQVQEGLGGIRDIIIDQSQPVYEESFRRLDDAYRRAQTMNAFVAAAPRYVVEFAGIVLIALLALFMSTQPGGVAAAIPVLGAMALGAQRLLPLVQQMYFGWSYLAGSANVIIDVVDLLHAPVMTRRPRDKNAPVHPFQRDLVLKEVEVLYPGSSQPALHAIDLKIERGQRIGILGETGSGKSTLLDVIMGLIQPTEGEVRVDGVRLSDATLADWQGQITHVPQFIYLADNTIAANIAFGEAPENINIDRVRAAAARAQIASFIESLPDGYQTSTGERGVRLSGGQRQRIGIARALYKRANVLILDEATSALDDVTEAAVVDALSGSSRDITILMIAHRLSTLASCDRILRLGNGRILEMGSFQEVIGEHSAASASAGGK